MKILLDTCACILYVSDNVMTRVQLANNILVHIIMLLFKSHPVAVKNCQLKKVSKNTYALINMVRHFPVLHFQVVHFQSPPGLHMRHAVKANTPILGLCNAQPAYETRGTCPLQRLRLWGPSVFGLLRLLQLFLLFSLGIMGS